MAHFHCAPIKVPWKSQQSSRPIIVLILIITIITANHRKFIKLFQMNNNWVFFQFFLRPLDFVLSCNSNNCNELLFFHACKYAIINLCFLLPLISCYLSRHFVCFNKELNEFNHFLFKFIEISFYWSNSFDSAEGWLRGKMLQHLCSQWNFLVNGFSRLTKIIVILLSQ